MGNTLSTPAWMRVAAASTAAIPTAPTIGSEDLTGDTVLLFLIDVTGSMGQWISAVNAALPSLVHSVAITDIFTKMAVLEYSDYDEPVARVCQFSKWCVTSDTADVASLAKFAREMRPRGGGGCPEAFKSALHCMVKEALEVSRASRVHVLHLTDAPPHCGPNLDTEGKKEKEALGAGFEWRNVVLKVLSSLPTMRYTALTSSPHALYCDLAARTGGSSHRLQGEVTASNIRSEIGRIMNGWLGLPNAHPVQSVFGDGTAPFNCDAAPPDENAIAGITIRETRDASMEACRVLKPRMMNAVSRLRKDALFRVPCLNALGEILDMDPMALTVSPVVGKLWREMCKMRFDERRDELIERLSKSKAKLAAVDRETLDKWLRESYDAKAEIDTQLRDWMKVNQTRGLVRFVPEDESLCAQQVVQLLARNDKQSTAMIRAILSRMLIDTSALIPKLDSRGDAAPRHVDPVAACVPGVTAGDDRAAAAGLRSASPFFRAAIVVLLPPDVSARVDTFREGNDNAFPRWMPHITIAFPFLSPEVFDEVIPTITAALASKAAQGLIPKPFQVSLKEFGCFPGAKAVLHLKPEVQGRAPNGTPALQALHDFIVELFPQVARNDRASFEAHVTVGQCAGAQAEAKAAQLKAQWTTPATFTVSQFHLIVHPDDAPGYVVKHSFDLPMSVPTTSAVQRGLAAAVDNDDDVEEEELPLQAGTLPLNMPTEQVMMLLMHTVAPGTKLSRRYAAMLAMHAILCGSVLTPVASEYLASVKGKWINWRRRESDNTPEVPENFASAFVGLMLHPAMTEYITEEEAAFARHLQRIFLVLRFYHTEVAVQTLDATSADGRYPDHTMLCEGCNKARPLSVMSADGKCGYCVEKRADDVAECDASSQLQVRCFTCGSFYARNGAVHIPGHSKCHGCHRLGTPSPSCECRVCHLRVVQYFNTDAGLPKGGVCGPCAHGLAPRTLSLKDHVALAHQVMPAAFTRLCAAVGLAPVDETPGAVLNLFSVGICDAVLLVRELEHQAPPATADEVSVTFRNATPVNAATMVEEIQRIMAGTAVAQRAECCVCLSDDCGRLGPACGRKGCNQRVCRACAVAWYGKNVPGRKLYERALLCQFCARTPAPNVLRSVAPRLLGVSTRARHMVLNPQEFHAWCERCDAIEVIGHRDCAELGGGDAQDNVEHFLCVQCTGRRGAVVEPHGGAGGDAKECPGCTVMVEKIDGCDHITCTNCNQHWCWVCREAFSSAEDTYEHMYSAHVEAEEEEEDA